MYICIYIMCHKKKSGYFTYTTTHARDKEAHTPTAVV